MRNNTGATTDSGTISAIPYVLLTLIIFGLSLVMFGAVVDELVTVDAGSYLVSVQHDETTEFLLMCFRALPFVGVFCAVIFLLMNGVQRDSGGI